MKKLSLCDLELRDRRVILRVDYNVPLRQAADGSLEVADATRLEAGLPTLRFLLARGVAGIILLSHLGRPKGEVRPEFSLLPVRRKLSELLDGREVDFADDCVGEEALRKARALEGGGLLLLENLRFHAEETAGEPAFAARLAELGDVFVNDSFGAAHRAHASISGIPPLVSRAATGLLVEKEIFFLREKLKSPRRPFTVIMGGAKVSDKIDIITTLFERANVFLIGGAMTHTFRKAQGFDIGDSLAEPDKTDLALEIIALAKRKRVRFLLPANSLEAREMRQGAEKRHTRGPHISPGWQGLDIGDQAAEEYAAEVSRAGTILWNGPPGVFEIDDFSGGTRRLAEAIAYSPADSIIGGGDSVAAVKKFGLQDHMNFLSTGGGASLELLSGNPLPGIEALSDA